MAYTPFKMRGNPMQRNFGIGASPAKKGHKDNQETKPAKTYTYREDPERKRTDAQGRTQKEVLEMRKKNEKDYRDKVQAYEKKKGGLTEAEAKKANKRASELSKRTVFSADSIMGVNKELERQAKIAMEKKRKDTSEFDAATKMMKKSATKMKKKSPAKKPLVGKQKNLPEGLKKKILAAPSKMKKKSAMKLKKSPAKMGHKKK
tara:strand:+ start:496 stop:1107 length:612 start_codon:yes stop_codon:yes gene_type:complete